MRPPDADGRSAARIEKRARRDIEFLAELRRAVDDRDDAALRRIAANHSSKNAPSWRRIAIQRAFARLAAV